MQVHQTRILIYFSLILAIVLLGFVFIKNLIDFPVYYAAGQSLIRGRTDLYAADFALGRVMDYRYPPIFLLALTPLWILPYKVAAYVWYLFSVLQIAGSVLLLKKIIAIPELPKSLWVLLFFSTAQYFVMILHYGNAHLLAIFFLVASSYFAFIKKDIWAALFMALAITIKLTPALLLIYFVIKKRWKYLCLVGLFLVVLNIFPALYFGFAENLNLHKTWFSHVIVNQEFHEENGPINLSLKGQLRRYFTQVDYRQRIDGDTRYPLFNLFSLSSYTTDRFWILLSLIVLSGVVILILKSVNPKAANRKAVPQGNDYLVEVGLFICVMLFVGPLTSKIYFIALLVPIFALAVHNNKEGNRIPKMVLIAIAILNSVLPLLPGRLLQRWFLVLGVDFYVNLLLMVTLFYYYLILHQPPSQSPSVEPQRPIP